MIQLLSSSPPVTYLYGLIRMTAHLMMLVTGCWLFDFNNLKRNNGNTPKKSWSMLGSVTEDTGLDYQVRAKNGNACKTWQIIKSKSICRPLAAFTPRPSSTSGFTRSATCMNKHDRIVMIMLPYTGIISNHSTGPNSSKWRPTSGRIQTIHMTSNRQCITKRGRF